MTRRAECRHCGEPLPCGCRTPLAHRGDPSTSHESAARTRAGLTQEKARAFGYVERYPDRTAVELADIAGDRDVRRIHRRLTELLRIGAIEVSRQRKCGSTGRTAQTYRVAPRAGQGSLF